MLRSFAIFLCTITASAAVAQTPPPPDPVYRETGFVTRWPGYPYKERRNVAAIDVGIVTSGRSPLTYDGGAPFFYLNTAGTYTGRYVQAEGRTMLAPLVIDALLGIGMLNLNLAQSDDFPPFVQAMNARGSRGVWELFHGKAGFVFGATERTSWMYALHLHGTFFGAPIGALPGFALGVGAALSHNWIDPLWDLTISFYGGPEFGSYQGYAGFEAIWRRAMARHFGYYVRYNTNLHVNAIDFALRPAGYLEVGFTFSNFE